MAIGLQMLLFTGCAVVGSSKVDPSTIYTTYKAQYDARLRELSYSASFQVGEGFATEVMLDGGSDVRIDGASMSIETSILNQISYTSTYRNVNSEELNKTHTFVFTNTRCQESTCSGTGETFQNTFRLPSAIALAKIKTQTPSRATALTLTWATADTIRTRESVYAELSRNTSEASSSRTAYASHPSGSSGNVTFSTEDLVSFGPGPAELRVCHEYYSSSIQAPAAGGSLRLLYCSEAIDINID